MYLNYESIAWLSLAGAFGWTAIAYEGAATKRGWPVGRLFAGSESWVQVLSYIILFICIGFALKASPWWSVFIVIVGANVLCRLIIAIFGPLSQPISLLGIVATGISFLWIFLNGVTA